MLPMKSLKRYARGFHNASSFIFASSSDYKEVFHLGAKVFILKLSLGNGCML